MNGYVRLASIKDASIIYNLRNKYGSTIPVDSCIPIEKVRSLDELHEIFLELQRWHIFWIVIDNNKKPVGWFEIEKSTPGIGSSRIQGITKVSDRKTRWLQAEAVFHISRDALLNKKINLLSTSVYALNKYLIESYLLSGFRIEGVNFKFPSSKRKSQSLVNMSISSSLIHVAPANWLFKIK
jgi:hypothetical protein